MANINDLGLPQGLPVVPCDLGGGRLGFWVDTRPREMIAADIFYSAAQDIIDWQTSRGLRSDPFALPEKRDE
jgi:hypothetical protein